MTARGARATIFSMETLRTFAVNTARDAWMRALVPSMVLAIALAADQCTRGPSITAMILTNLLG